LTIQEEVPGEHLLKHDPEKAQAAAGAIILQGEGGDAGVEVDGSPRPSFVSGTVIATSISAARRNPVTILSSSGRRKIRTSTSSRELGVPSIRSLSRLSRTSSSNHRAARSSHSAIRGS
jgi:hypothetical protein